MLGDVIKRVGLYVSKIRGQAIAAAIYLGSSKVGQVA